MKLLLLTCLFTFSCKQSDNLLVGTITSSPSQTGSIDPDEEKKSAPVDNPKKQEEKDPSAGNPPAQNPTKPVAPKDPKKQPNKKKHCENSHSENPKICDQFDPQFGGSNIMPGKDFMTIVNFKRSKLKSYKCRDGKIYVCALSKKPGNGKILKVDADLLPLYLSKFLKDSKGSIYSGYILNCETQKELRSTDGPCEAICY